LYGILPYPSRIAGLGKSEDVHWKYEMINVAVFFGMYHAVTDMRKMKWK
jgi:hypothetical protein